MRMPGSSIDTRTAEELENLMNEFPDWKEQFPEIYQDAYPTRLVYTGHIIPG